jgi:hypothetical protein
VASLKGDNLVIFYCLVAFEIGLIRGVISLKGDKGTTLIYSSYHFQSKTRFLFNILSSLILAVTGYLKDTKLIVDQNS